MGGLRTIMDLMVFGAGAIIALAGSIIRDYEKYEKKQKYIHKKP